jgi:hypothetical protein
MQHLGNWTREPQPKLQRASCRLAGQVLEAEFIRINNNTSTRNGHEKENDRLIKDQIVF